MTAVRKKRISSKRKSTSRKAAPKSRSTRGKSVAQARTQTVAKDMAKPGAKHAEATHIERCTHCERTLATSDRAIFVEEEIGRMFCSENCIVAYFSSDIEKLENEYFRNVLPGDLTPREKDGLSDLKWKTLEQPGEVYAERVRSGDLRHTLIGSYTVGSGSSATEVWCVCICLFLRGEPSFLYLSFLTRHPETVDAYRRGDKKKIKSKGSRAPDSDEARRDPSARISEVPSEFEGKVDRLAEAWTEDETNQAQLVEIRRKDDIAADQFRMYDSCIDETLQVPDEVWTLKGKDSKGLDVYHFIRQYPDLSPVVWYVIVARETDDREQIEILDAFPTKDSGLVERYRKGKQEIGPQSDSEVVSRLVH